MKTLKATIVKGLENGVRPEATDQERTTREQTRDICELIFIATLRSLMAADEQLALHKITHFFKK